MDAEMIPFLKNTYTSFKEFTSQTATPLTINYKTPETLGPDRLAASIGATILFPNKNVLVVNMGTCITYDITTAKKEYMGGKISPGAQMRLKALHTFTAKLPLVELTSFNNNIGQSTNDSILAGVFNGVLYEIEGTIDALSKRYSNLQTLLSGGDAPLFVKAIKKPIFTEPFLVLKGLNEVITHHAK
jgi:type III pantothenate kinase